jgi:hypothetical protein
MSTQAESGFDPRAILAALERSHTEYVLIGGLARVLRGTGEITTGVDICPSVTGANVDRLRHAVIALEAQRADGTDLRLSTQALKQEAIIGLQTSYGQLNLVARPAGVARGYTDLYRAATIEPLGHGLRPCVASAGDLAAMADALHREDDLARLPELHRIMELELDRQHTIIPATTRPATATPSVGPIQRDPIARRGPRLTR